MTNPSLEPSLVDLLDNYAMNSMVALMQIYAPEEWPEGGDDAVEWCDWVSSRSYFMASSMMDARHKFHAVLTSVQQEMLEKKESDD
jgi:hypothetical protein